MEYPAIVYKRDRGATTHAANIVYNYVQRYAVTVIDSDPDSPIVKALTVFPKCVFVTHFARAGLNHDVFALYF